MSRLKQKTKLNGNKPRVTIFNYSEKHQLTTNLKVDDGSIEIVKEAKLSGTVLTDKLTWDQNIQKLTKKVYKRMQLLSAAAVFTNSKKLLNCI